MAVCPGLHELGNPSVGAVPRRRFLTNGAAVPNAGHRQPRLTESPVSARGGPTWSFEIHPTQGDLGSQVVLLLEDVVAG